MTTPSYLFHLFIIIGKGHLFFPFSQQVDVYRVLYIYTLMSYLQPERRCHKIQATTQDCTGTVNRISSMVHAKREDIEMLILIRLC